MSLFNNNQFNKITCFFLVLFYLPSFAQQDKTSDQIISFGKKLYYDSTLTVKYFMPPQGIKELLHKPQKFQFLLYQNLYGDPDRFKMIQEKNYWKTSFIISDTTVKMVLFTITPIDSLASKKDKPLDKKSNQIWDLLIHHPNGKPVKGAHQARAISYSGFSSLRDENLQLAISSIESELIYYPYNFSARLLFYSLLLRQYDKDNESKNFIQKDVETILKELPETEDVLLYAISALNMIGDQSEIKRLQNRLFLINPKNTIEAWKAFQKIHEIEDDKTREKKLESFLDDYPDSQFEEMALAQLSTIFISAADTSQLIHISNILLQKAKQTTGANALARISSALLSYPQYLDDAQSYISKAIQINNQADFSAKPPEVDFSDWRDQIKQMNSYYHSILARIWIQQGEKEKGIESLEKESNRLLRADLYLELGDIYQADGINENALIYFARASYFEDLIGDSAYARFFELGKKMNFTETQLNNTLDEEMKWVEDHYTDKILSKRSIRKAPDFDLQESSGRWVRLADQEGDVILLCFWASWSNHSKRLLMDIQELSDIYGQDVLFLTVSVDKDDSKAEYFLRRNNLYLPVLFQRNKTSSFQLKGVPTIFVIDENLNIHFEHKGYRPDLIHILQIELEDLLGNSE